MFGVQSFEPNVERRTSNIEHRTANGERESAEGKEVLHTN
jgi:hypothetical protein